MNDLNALVQELQEEIAKGKKIKYYKHWNEIIKLSRKYTRFLKYKEKYKDAYEDLYDDVFFETLLKAIKTYNHEKGSFKTYLTFLVDRAMLTKMIQWNNHNKNWSNHKVEPTSFNEPLKNDDDDEDNGTLEDVVDEPKQPINPIELLPLMLDAVRLNQRKYVNSPKTCWSKLFFTENVTMYLSISENGYRIVNEKPDAYLSAISFDFLNSYVTKECRTIDEIIMSELKPDTDFVKKGTGDLCGYPLLGAVYAKYTGTSESSVSQQRDHYRALIHDAFYCD